MESLLLEIDGDRIRGEGQDIVAPFTLDGHLSTDGLARIRKQYVGQHQVLYVGQFDGEGTFRGTWDIQGYRGEWLIRLTAAVDSQRAPIEEFSPPSK